MEPPPPPPQSATKARIWLRILAWSIPGITSPALLLGGIMFGFGNPGYETAALVGMIVILVLLIVGCGFFDIVLRAGEPVSARGPKAVAGQLALFVLAQLFVIPALGFATGGACTAVMSTTR